MPERYKEVTRLLDKLSTDIEKPQNGHVVEEQLLFVCPVKLTTGKIKLDGYAYLNPQRAQKEKESFYKRLLTIRDRLEELPPGKRVQAVVDDKAGELSSYFILRSMDGRICIEIDEQKVNHRLRHTGLVILAYRGSFSWDECLSLYKSKQLIEMSFDILKNDLEMTTPHVHSTETFRGLLFISLISLLLRMRILKALQTTGLNKVYSFERVILELQKLKIICFSDGNTMVAELTKKQKELLDAFNAVPK